MHKICIEEARRKNTDMWAEVKISMICLFIQMYIRCVSIVPLSIYLNSANMLAKTIILIE